MGDGADEYLDGEYASALDDDGITCRRCKVDGLHWERHRVSNRGPRPWRLFNDEGELHVCQKEPTP